MAQKRKWKYCLNSGKWYLKRDECYRINIQKNQNQELCKRCIARNKLYAKPFKPKKTSKHQLLINWLEENNYAYEVAKTNSIYIHLTDKKDEWCNLKISNHQIINIPYNPFGKDKEMLKANKELNLKLLENGKDYSFADLEKNKLDYGKINYAPDYWIPIYGNYKLELLKDIIIKEFIKE